MFAVLRRSIGEACLLLHGLACSREVAVPQSCQQVANEDDPLALGFRQPVFDQEVQALCHSPTHLRAEALDRWLLAFGVGNHEVPI